MFKDQAKECARKLCSYGTCHRGYSCGHGNKAKQATTLLGKGTTCPLEKYKIKPDPKPAYLRIYDVPSSEELFAVCAECKYASVVEDGDYLMIDESTENSLDYCIDCPVTAYVDLTAELAVEAAMS